MKNILSIILIALFSLYSSAQKSNYKVILNKGLSSPSSDFAPRFVDDNYQTLIFTSNRNQSDESLSKMFYTSLKNGSWKIPVQIIKRDDISGNGIVTTDSKRGIIFFTKCPLIKNKNATCKIYYSFMKGDLIGEPMLLDIPMNSEGSLGPTTIGQPSFSNNLDVLFFASNMPGGYGKFDIWYSKYDRKTDTWGKPQNASPEINTADDEFYPFIASDGTLYFSSAGHKGMGGWDIFKATQKKGLIWNEAENMGEPINSTDDDFGIVFKGNTQSGLLSSNRKGGIGSDDIYDFTLANKEQPVQQDFQFADSSNTKTLNALTTIFNKETCTENSELLNITNVKLYPNPNKGEFTFDFISNQKINLTIRVYSTLGQLLSNEIIEVEKGNFTKQFSFKNVNSGIYYVNVLHNCEVVQSVKMIVQ